MAKTEIKFIDCVDDYNYITVKKNICDYATSHSNSVKIDTISIKLFFEGQETYIDLDKSTAIKFAKTLRTEINKITESEVANG